MLRHQKSGFHLKRRQNEQPNLHLQKPGSCVSLLPVTRSRTRRVRKPRPCCGAARFHVSFHDKHFHRCTLLLSSDFSVSPTAVFVGGAQQDRRKGNNIYTQTSYMCDILTASVVIRLLFIRCIKSTQNSSKTHCGCLFGWIPHHLQLRNDPIPPDLSSLFVMAVPCCVFSSKGPSLSPCPSLLLLKCVISPSHHHRASKTAHRYFFF